MSQDFNEQKAIQYFLGELSETDQSEFEERFFTDEFFSEWLDEVETDLIDDYLRGELSATEKMKFEEKYLVSERRRTRVLAATAILENEKSAVKVPIVEASQSSFWEKLRSFFVVPQFAVAVPLILILALVGAIIFFFRQPTIEIVKKGNENINAPFSPTPIPSNSPEISPIPTNSPKVEVSPNKTETPKTTPTATPKETPQIESPQPIIATITLFPSLRSGEEGKKVVLKKETKSLNVRLTQDRETEFEKYQAEVRDSTGSVVTTFNLANKKSFNISIPTKSLANGNYKIALKGVNNSGESRNLSFYYFSVEKK